MKALAIFSVIISILTFQHPGYAQSLRDATVVFRAGNWKVLRLVDPMDDTVRCTGIYKDDYRIQLSPDNLFIGIQGGIETVTLRFGDKPAQKLRLASEMEKKIRSAIITGAEFEELNGSKRLLYQVNTLISGIKTGEINLDGFDEALSNIRSGCPLKKEPQKG